MKNSMNKIALAMLTVSLLGLGTATATAQKRGGSQRVGKKPVTVRQQVNAPVKRNLNYGRANQPVYRGKIQKKAKANQRRDRNRHNRRNDHKQHRRYDRKVNIIGSVLNTFGHALHGHRHSQFCDSYLVGGYYRNEVFRDFVPGHYENRVVRRSYKRGRRHGRQSRAKVKRVWVKGYYVSRTRQVWVPRERVYRCGH